MDPREVRNEAAVYRRKGGTPPKNSNLQGRPPGDKYGGWLAHKWDRKKMSGWVKLHVDVDTDEILAFVVTDEKVGDISCTERPMDLNLRVPEMDGLLTRFLFV